MALFVEHGGGLSLARLRLCHFYAEVSFFPGQFCLKEPGWRVLLRHKIVDGGELFNCKQKSSSTNGIVSWRGSRNYVLPMRPR